MTAGSGPPPRISLSAAGALLRAGGQGVAPAAAVVCVESKGRANGVSEAVAALGLTAGDTCAGLQAKWDRETERMGFLLAAGAFGLLCAAALLAARRKITLLEHGQAWGMLLWMGMEERTLCGILLLQAAMLSLFGAAMGAAAAAALPSFLPRELIGRSVFLLPVPGAAAAAGLAACLVAALLPMALEPGGPGRPGRAEAFAGEGAVTP